MSLRLSSARREVALKAALVIKNDVEPEPYAKKLGCQTVPKAYQTADT